MIAYAKMMAKHEGDHEQGSPIPAPDISVSTTKCSTAPHIWP